MKRLFLAAASCAGVALAGNLQASVLYSGGTYAQSFDSLPNAPTDTSIETSAFTDGWQDDVNPVTSPQNDVSIPGWYLWHSVSPASENGFNGNQRFRIGAGSGNTGAFMSFGSAASTERALGSVGSTTIANQPTGTPPANDTRVLIALRMTNNTGVPLTEFTLTYDGEQWRDGGNTAPPPPEVTEFAYSLDATAPQTGTFTPVSGLNFTSPVNNNSTTTGVAVDGNVAGRVDNISATVTGINWLPGTDIWLRWNDPQRLGNDHGMAIDDVEFVAVPEPTTIGLLSLGAVGLLGRRRTR
jgi:large repetitive protein